MVAGTGLVMVDVTLESEEDPVRETGVGGMSSRESGATPRSVSFLGFLFLVGVAACFNTTAVSENTFEYVTPVSA